MLTVQSRIFYTYSHLHVSDCDSCSFISGDRKTPMFMLVDLSVTFVGPRWSSHLYSRQSFQSFLPAKHPCIFPFPYFVYSSYRTCSSRTSSGVVLWSSGTPFLAYFSSTISTRNMHMIIFPCPNCF